MLANRMIRDRREHVRVCGLGPVEGYEVANARGVMISSASTAPVKPCASPSRSPAKISPFRPAYDLPDPLPPVGEEGVAHLEQRSWRVGDSPVGVQHDNRRAEQDDGEHLGGEPDAVHERDQRHDGRRW